MSRHSLSVCLTGTSWCGHNAPRSLSKWSLDGALGAQCLALYRRDEVVITAALVVLLLSYGPPWAHYLGGYQDRLLGGPLGLPGLRHTAPEGVEHKD
jgi:hypothetical protein